MNEVPSFTQRHLYSIHLFVFRQLSSKQINIKNAFLNCELTLPIEASYNSPVNTQRDRYFLTTTLEIGIMQSFTILPGECPTFVEFCILRTNDGDIYSYGLIIITNSIKHDINGDRIYLYNDSDWKAHSVTLAYTCSIVRWCPELCR